MFKAGIKISNAIIILLFLSFISLSNAELILDANFENGLAVDYKITGPDTINFGPLNGNKNTWYSFKLKGVKNKKVTFVFEWKKNGAQDLANFWSGKDTAMVTYDGKGYEIVKNVVYAPKDPATLSGTTYKGNLLQSFSHVFRENEALVSYFPPWTNARLAALAEKLKTDQRVAIDSIGNSKFKNLPITYFRITDKNAPDASKKKILIVAREDSYEAGGSWAAEGMIKFLLSGSTDANEVLKNTVFYIFPLLSADGVAMGTTNYPLDPAGTGYVHFPDQWSDESTYHEVKLMKDFWAKLKSKGEEIDMLLTNHSDYCLPSFSQGDFSKENRQNSKKLGRIFRANLPWRTFNEFGKPNKGFMGNSLLKVFPNAITYAGENSFALTAEYLKAKSPVHRRQEDIMQDGEMIVRSYAKYYELGSDDAPCFMAGDVDKNNGKKGETVKFSGYYFDVNELPAAKVEVIINGKPYPMSAAVDANYKKSVRFGCDYTLSEPVTDYYFVVSNGKKERRVPEEYNLPGPFISE